MGGAWALCVWGRDESLASVLATHLPPLVFCAVAVVALAASLLGRWLPGWLAAGGALFVAVVPLGGWTQPSQPPAAGAIYRVLTWNVEQWLGGGVRLAQ